MVKLVSIDNRLLALYKSDKEVLQKVGRPCALILRLKYKGANHDFAIPLRSNISPTAPRDEYYPLPNRSTTKPHHHHGLHYIKIMPVTKQYLMRFRTKGNPFATIISNVLRKNAKQIVAECQDYLDRYAEGIHSPFSTDIDALLSILNSQPSSK